MIFVLAEEIAPWLKYIWEQFVLVNALKSHYVLMKYGDFQASAHEKDGSAIVEYGTENRYPGSLFIPRKNKFKTDDYFWLNKNIPLYKDTIMQQDNEGVNFDIFYNAFVHLSRLEEWEFEKSGGRIRSYSFNHPRKEKSMWKIPVVNHLFNELERRLLGKFTGLSFGERALPVIEFSHDVDYIEKTLQLRIKRTSFDLLAALRYMCGLRLGKSFSKLAEGVKFCCKDSDYWCFDSWDDLEESLEIRSIYYFFVSSEEKAVPTLKRWLLDPSYNISRNSRLINKCKELLMKGNKLGLHGSYYSAFHESLFRNEKEVLENLLNVVIVKTRQHWLNFSESITPYIHQSNGIAEDSTIGFNDTAGFRAGIASGFNPYDHRNQCAFSFREIPLVIMDSHLYDYSGQEDLDSLGWFFNAIKNVKKCEISINWHQRVINEEYGWAGLYRQIGGRFQSEWRQ